MILGQSLDERYSWHANEAVRLYENMYLHHEPTPEQAAGIAELLEDARAVQAQAKGRDDAQEVSSLTKEEQEKADREYLDEQGMAADEDYAKLMYGEVDDDEISEEIEDDDEISEVEDEDEISEEVAEEVETGEEQSAALVEAEDGAQDATLPKESEMAEQQVEAEDDQKNKTKQRPRMSVADRQIIADGAASMQAGASSLPTPSATRTATGNDSGASRRSSRRKSGGGNVK
jgi:hypothetical protein